MVMTMKLLKHSMWSLRGVHTDHNAYKVFMIHARNTVINWQKV